MTELQLNQGQADVAHAFAMFMASPERFFTISGPAGVGKTTLLKHLKGMKDHIKVCQLLDRPVIDRWAFTATTNKAAEVLDKTLGHDAQTIHSFLGLQVYNDYASGETKISRKRQSEVQEDTLIVIDECSMIDRTLLRYLDECTMNCKFVFVGDHCQMAPIKENTSPVFDLVQPHVLTEIVRSQHTPAITALANQLRQTVETGIFEPIKEVPGVIDYLTPEQAEMEIYDHFIADQKDARILCYTNKMVVALNNWIRSARHLPETYTVGERVVSNSATHFQDNRYMTRVEQDLEILEVSQPYVDEVQAGKIFHSIPAYDVVTNAGKLTIPLDPAMVSHVLKQLKKDTVWGPYFSIKERYADLRPRDVCTVYKAQGSTYETVFVHLKDIGSCTNPAQAARMLYVACSRPTHRICLIGELPARFQGNPWSA